MKRSHVAVCALATLTVIYGGLFASAVDPVKDFSLPSAADGTLIRLSDHAGKVVLINWWRTSCGYSQRESPKLVALYNKYKNKGFVILGVSDDASDSVADIPAYLKQHGIVWPVGLNDQGEFMRGIRPQGGGEAPGNYIISRRGQLTYLGLDRSPEDWRKIENTVEQLTAEASPREPSAFLPPRDLPAAPDFKLMDLTGVTVSLKKFSAKPLVVNFFNAGTADWTGPVLAKLHADYATKGLQVIGINLFDEDDAIRTSIQAHRIKYPVVRGDEAVQTAWIGSNAAWAVFFVTADGKIFKKITDSIPNGLEDPVFRKYADYLLKHPQGPSRTPQ